MRVRLVSVVRRRGRRFEEVGSDDREDKLDWSSED